jgi:hypothetical protein
VRRLLIANLDFEDDLARAAGLDVPALRPAVVSGLVTLSQRLRALGGAGDELWTLADGALPEGPREVLAWGESAAVAAVRGGPCPEGPVELGDWRAALWRLWPAVEVAAACNHRGFGFALAQRLGSALPGARMVGSLAALDAVGDGLDGAWVVKAPYSASGRHRLRHRGPPDAAARTRISRLLAGGPLLFEPWVERIADLGVVGLIDRADNVRLFPPHRLDNDPAGVFRGIDVDGADVATEGERAQIMDAAAAAAAALAARGYRGPFGIDAFVWRDAAGARRLQPMSEINARLTFGLVARATA